MNLQLGHENTQNKCSKFIFFSWQSVSFHSEVTEYISMTFNIRKFASNIGRLDKFSFPHYIIPPSRILFVHLNV
jgi:hypothetical protein